MQKVGSTALHERQPDLSASCARPVPPAFIVVLLVWVYWSAQVFMPGAEFTWVFAHSYGSRRHLPGL